MSEIQDIPTAFSEVLVEIGNANDKVVVLDADISDSCKTEPFYEHFPDRAFDFGVAEQSLPTYAAGLALMGKIPFYNTFAVFAVHRGFDMIRQSVAYNHANVKIIGHCGGQSLGYAGPSHHTLEDISAMRALPNMVILHPSDAEETRQMARWMVDYKGPVYLRLSRSKVDPFHVPDYTFELGKTERITEGKDATLFVTGDLITLALEVNHRLREQDLTIQVVNVPTLKPLPANEITRHGELTQVGITLEDHNVIGGLGSAVAEIYAEHLQKPLRRIGIPDTFTESDDKKVLLEAYGVSVESCSQAVQDLLNRRGSF